MEELKELREQKIQIEQNIDELELTKKEKWHEVKDFENSVGEVKKFTNWIKNKYKPDINSLNRQLRIVNEKIDQI